MQLDEVLTSLQSDSREDLQGVLEGLNTTLNSEPTAEQDAESSPLARGQTASESFNDALDDIPAAERSTAQVLEALLGTQPGRDVARLIRGTANTADELARYENQLKDLITNLNATTATFAGESANLQASIRELPPTLRSANAAFDSLNAAFPPTRAFATEIRPGVRETPATIEAAFPWIEQTRALVGEDELGGLAKELAPASADLARLVDRATELLPQTDLAAKCLRDVVLPAGDIVVNDEFTTGEENYKEFFYALVGHRRRGPELRRQRHVRALPDRRRLADGLARQPELDHRAAVRQQPGGAARQPPGVPRQAPAVQARGALLPAADPGRQRARRGQVAPDRRAGDDAGPVAARQAAQGGRPQRRAQEAEPVRLGAEGRGAARAGEGQVRTAIRKHLPDFLAILGLLVIAVAVATVILGKQRLALPAWVPLIGQDFFVLEAEMATAQAVTPGQGQTVNVAGVEVGEITSVKLRDGKAIIGMKLEPRVRDGSTRTRRSCCGRRPG